VDVTAKGHPVRVVAPFEYEIPKIDGSRFIATLVPADSDLAVVERQVALRAAHPHSRHVCLAYVGRSELDVRFSDDGEPAKTAGYPMLRALLGASVRCSGALVTRYFGGVKLGTGGLVRAYTAAVREALLRAPLQPVVPTLDVVFRCRYSAEPMLRHQLAKFDLNDFHVEYHADLVEFRVRCPESVVEHVVTASGARTGGDIERIS